MHYLTADYIFPVFTAPLRGGILELDDDGTVVGLHERSTTEKDYPGLHYYPGILCPGFINSHCHLELSWAKGMIAPSGGLDHFLRQLDTARKNIDPGAEAAAVWREGDIMLKSGTVAVGDIANTLSTAGYKDSSPLLFHTFCEVFASDPLKARSAYDRIVQLNKTFRSLERNNRSSVVPHSTYSLSEELFRLITGQASSTFELLTIHHQESEDEMQFFLDGSGPIADRRKYYNPGIAAFVPTGRRPLESIAHCFRPEQPLMLVHNTMSAIADIEFAEGYFRNLAWCFCPNANLYIENRLPSFSLFREKGVRMLLGTDSLASNTSLSILEEMKAIQSAYPEIPTEEMIVWATKNAAGFFGFGQLGSLEPGKQPGVVWIENVDLHSLRLTPESRSTLIWMHGNDSLYQ